MDEATYYELVDRLMWRFANIGLEMGFIEHTSGYNHRWDALASQRDGLMLAWDEAYYLHFGETRA